MCAMVKMQWTRSSLSVECSTAVNECEGKGKSIARYEQDKRERKLANFILLCENWQHSFIQVNFHWLLMRHWRERKPFHSIQVMTETNFPSEEGEKETKTIQANHSPQFQMFIQLCTKFFMNVTIKSKFLCKFYWFSPGRLRKYFPRILNIDTQ